MPRNPFKRLRSGTAIDGEFPREKGVREELGAAVTTNVRDEASACRGRDKLVSDPSSLARKPWFEETPGTSDGFRSSGQVHPSQPGRQQRAEGRICQSGGA